MQRPVDHFSHLRYTDLALDFVSHLNHKAIATNVFYIAMIIILAFGENGALCNVAHFTLPSVATWVLVALSAVSALVSLLGYVPGFLKQLKENKAQNTAK